MKYIAVVVIIMAFVRVDILLGLFDKAAEKLSNKSPQEVSANDLKASLETVSLKDDKSIRQTPKGIFLSILEDFQVNPTADLRSRAINYLRSNPALFGPKLDHDLELAVYKWRELLNNNEPELVNLLLDLQNVLLGENLEMTKRFFSLWIEINVDHFMAAYIRSKDLTCTIATVFGDPIPEEEKLNEYYDREEAFREFIAKEKVDPSQKALAQNCVAQLTIVIQALKAKLPPPPPEEAPEEQEPPGVQTMGAPLIPPGTVSP